MNKEIQITKSKNFFEHGSQLLLPLPLPLTITKISMDCNNSAVKCISLLSMRLNMNYLRVTKYNALLFHRHSNPIHFCHNTEECNKGTIAISAILLKNSKTEFLCISSYTQTKGLDVLHLKFALKGHDVLRAVNARRQ